LNPPAVWDGTDAARKLLSTVFRAQQHSGFSFGAGHIMDILRGKATEKVTQYGHDQLSTFGIGANFSEIQLRGVLRQLIAMGALNVDGQVFNTLQLTEGSRAVLKGEVSVQLRESLSQKPEKRSRKPQAPARQPPTSVKTPWFATSTSKRGGPKWPKSTTCLPMSFFTMPLWPPLLQLHLKALKTFTASVAWVLKN
jgi:superfamily II DNA helicase RecQ